MDGKCVWTLLEPKIPQFKLQFESLMGWLGDHLLQGGTATLEYISWETNCSGVNGHLGTNLRQA